MVPRRLICRKAEQVQTSRNTFSDLRASEGNSSDQNPSQSYQGCSKGPPRAGWPGQCRPTFSERARHASARRTFRKSTSNSCEGLSYLSAGAAGSPSMPVVPPLGLFLTVESRHFGYCARLIKRNEDNDDKRLTGKPGMSWTDCLAGENEQREGNPVLTDHFHQWRSLSHRPRHTHRGESLLQARGSTLLFLTRRQRLQTRTPRGASGEADGGQAGLAGTAASGTALALSKQVSLVPHGIHTQCSHFQEKPEPLLFETF